MSLYNEIKTTVNKIKNAYLGVDVRDNIAEGIDKLNDHTEGINIKQTNLETTFKNLVINAGNSNAEIAASRGDFDYLPDRMDNFDEQFNTIANDVKSVTNPITEKFPIITFIDDDCKANFFNIWKQVCDTKGIKVTLACVPDWIEKQTNEVMTLTQLKSLYNEGFDIISHTWSHDARIFKSSVSDLSLITDDEIKQEYYKAKDWLKNNGFENVLNLVYPWGDFGNETLRYKRIARHYYKNAINATGSVNPPPNDNMFLGRTFLNSNTDIATYKSLVDNLVGTNNWLIFGTHSNVSEINSAYLIELIEYIQSKNIAILTVKEALKYKENAVSFGEYTDMNNRLYVSKIGDVLLGLEKYIKQAYTLNSKWLSDSTRERVVVNSSNNSLEFHMCFTDLNKTGSYIQDEVMITLPNFSSTESKSYIYQGTIITGDGQILTCHFWVNVTSSGTQIKMVNNSTVANIRWIFMNFIVSK